MEAASEESLDIAGLTVHEFCKLLPALSDEDRGELRDSIRTHGLLPQFPILVWHDQIIDGRHRFEIAKELGIELRAGNFRTIALDDAGAFRLAMSVNIGRRHLNAAQRADLAAEIQKRIAGTAPDARTAAAELMHVSPGYVSRAAQIRERAPEVSERIRKGELSMPQAIREAGIEAKPRAAVRKAQNPTRLEDVREEYEERAAIKDDVSDEDWARGLPAAGSLSGRRLDEFVEHAIQYRNLMPALREFKQAVGAAIKGNRRKGPWMFQIEKALRFEGPEDWHVCSSEDGGCDGTGETPDIGDRATQCNNCRGAGYIVPLSR